MIYAPSHLQVPLYQRWLPEGRRAAGQLRPLHGHPGRRPARPAGYGETARHPKAAGDGGAAPPGLPPLPWAVRVRGLRGLPYQSQCLGVHHPGAAFITQALEDNYDQAAQKENYISYIASRPRAQRTGTHALFTDSDDPLVLSQVADAVARHPGNVWLPILSLRREDAARLGYDDAESWKTLLCSYAMEMAQAMKIPWDQFRWYAAFHDEGHHPHVHMVCYSADGKSGYLTRDGIAQIKSGLAQCIFRQELYEIYERQTQRRDDLIRESDEVMRQLIGQMRTGTLENEKIEQLLEHLAGKLLRQEAVRPPEGAPESGGG